MLPGMERTSYSNRDQHTQMGEKGFPEYQRREKAWDMCIWSRAPERE